MRRRNRDVKYKVQGNEPKTFRFNFFTRDHSSSGLSSATHIPI